MTDSSPSPIPWHPAFVQALQLELEPFLHSLEFTPELPLTSEPLRIDLLIIKKSPSLVIEKNIARIFKHTNSLPFTNLFPTAEAGLDLLQRMPQNRGNSRENRANFIGNFVSMKLALEFSVEAYRRYEVS